MRLCVDLIHIQNAVVNAHLSFVAMFSSYPFCHMLLWECW